MTPDLLPSAECLPTDWPAIVDRQVEAIRLSLLAGHWPRAASALGEAIGRALPARRQHWADEPLHSFLPHRLANCLEQQSIFNAAQLDRTSDERLLGFYGLGPRALATVRSALAGLKRGCGANSAAETEGRVA